MKNSFYLQNGKTVNIISGESANITNTLGGKTYVLKLNEMTNQFYLELTDDFVIPSKIYGNPIDKANRIVRTFNDRPKQTGVLLAGDKGSGKTLLSKMVADMLRQSGCAVIIINEPHCGTEFNQFIASITEPAVIIFDEFDKVYESDEQEKLLTLLDGTSETKKLFMLTANAGHIDEHMLNRPGRIYYKFEYDGLEDDFIQEYISDVLVHKEHEAELLRLIKAFEKINFDMLQAIVEEINRFNEDPKIIMQYLNVDVEYGKDGCWYDVSVLVDGSEIDNEIRPSYIRENPYNAYFDPVIVLDEEKNLKPDAFGGKPRINLDEMREVQLRPLGGGQYAYTVEKYGRQFTFKFAKRKLKKFDFLAF